MSLGFALGLEDMKPYAGVLGAVRGFCDMVSARNVMLGQVAGIAVDPGDFTAIDTAIAATEVYYAAQGALLGTHVLKAGLAFAKDGFQAMRLALKKSGGHHLIPRWSGGHLKQLLYQTDDIFTNSAHLDELEPIIRKRMKKYGIKIGVRGVAREALRDYIRKQGIQRQVFDELLDIYREYDLRRGTNLVQGFWANIIGGFFKDL